MSNFPDHATGSFSNLALDALTGFGSISVAGASGSGKTTLARSLMGMAQSEFGNPNTGFLLPYQFQQHGFRSRESDLITLDFLAVFMNTVTSPIIMEMMADEESTRIDSLLDNVAQDIAKTVRGELLAYMASSDRPSVLREKLQLSWDYQMGTRVESRTPDEVERLIERHKAATGEDPTESDIAQLRTRFISEDPSNVKIGNSDEEVTLKTMGSTDDPYVLMGWLASHPELLHMVAVDQSVMSSLRHVAQVVAETLRSTFGPTSVIRNEKKPRDKGVEIVLDIENSDVVAVDLTALTSQPQYAVVHASPLRAARALSYFSVVHVSTLSLMYSHDMESTTLSGGMSSGLTDSIQVLNDQAADAGARFVIELRDDFVPRTQDADELETFQNRFMASSRISFYLTDRGRGRWRSRAYTTHGVGMGDRTGDFTIEPAFLEYQEDASADDETRDKWFQLHQLQKGKNGGQL